MASILRRIIQPHPQKKMLVRLLTGNETKNQLNSKNTAALESPTGQTINLSESCVKRLEEICKDGSFLRMTVEGGGCSGFQYKFELDTNLTDEDLTFGTETAKVVTDTISMEYCNGATVDYHSELIRAGFRILANPKAEQGCSCGASFALKLD